MRKLCGSGERRTSESYGRTISSSGFATAPRQQGTTLGKLFRVSRGVQGVRRASGAGGRVFYREACRNLCDHGAQRRGQVGFSETHHGISARGFRSGDRGRRGRDKFQRAGILWNSKKSNDGLSVGRAL